MNIYIPERISRSPTLTDYELLVYCYLKALMQVMEFDKYYINVDSLLYALFKEDISIRTRKAIFSAINSLIEKNHISGIKANKDSYIIDTSSFYLDTDREHFTIVYLEDIQKILLSKSKIKVQLFKYYISLMDSINTKIRVYLPTGESKSNIIGHQTQEYLSSITGVSNRTIIRYTEILEELKVIYVCRAEDFIITDSGGLVQLPNVYGRYCDKEYIQKCAHDYKKHKGGYKFNQSNNNSRRIAQKYHWLCQGQPYSDQEVQEIYEYVIKNNQKYKDLYAKDGYEGHLNKIKDITIFKKYDFLEKPIN